MKIKKKIIMASLFVMIATAANVGATELNEEQVFKHLESHTDNPMIEEQRDCSIRCNGGLRGLAVVKVMGKDRVSCLRFSNHKGEFDQFNLEQCCKLTQQQCIDMSIQVCDNIQRIAVNDSVILGEKQNEINLLKDQLGLLKGQFMLLAMQKKETPTNEREKETIKRLQKQINEQSNQIQTLKSENQSLRKKKSSEFQLKIDQLQSQVCQLEVQLKQSQNERQGCQLQVEQLQFQLEQAKAIAAPLQLQVQEFQQSQRQFEIFSPPPGLDLTKTNTDSSAFSVDNEELLELLGVSFARPDQK